MFLVLDVGLVLVLKCAVLVLKSLVLVLVSRCFDNNTYLTFGVGGY